MTLAIIGTAGRGDDAKQLTAAHWRMMTCIAQSVACTLGVDELVSGGSAWADHLAVSLFLDGHVKRLTLHLPARFVKECPLSPAFCPSVSDGRRLNDLHAAFSATAGIDSFAQIQRAIERGATVHVNPGGFKARNSDVAAAASSLLAFTFSGNALPADGGTADTWRKFEAAAIAWVQQDPHERCCGCTDYPDPLTAYHFDLVRRQLDRHVFEDPRTVARRLAWQAQENTRRESRVLATARMPRTPEDEERGLL